MKILILTAVYPRPDAPERSTATKVIQYFAAEWQKSGHEVVVVHTVNRLMRPIYHLPKGIKAKIKAKTGFEVPDRTIIKRADYVVDGIPVLRRGLFKLIPQRLHSRSAVLRAAKDIHGSLVAMGFAPDLIVGHWASPNAQLLAALRAYYSCPNALVFHGAEYAEKFPKQISAALTGIDRVGARSAAIARRLSKALALDCEPFICYSGIPDDYVERMGDTAVSDFAQVTRFLYAGTLMERKCVNTVIEALSRHTDRPWGLDIVGEGACLSSLQTLAAECGVSDRVIFHGRVSRERVLELMQEADVFTMVSEGEAFGLVYLEAMAAGCLTVGSRNEGIDGVIVDGENGFLCRAGNVGELADVYRRIFAMTPEERRTVAKKAKNTAAAMTDSAVAERYLCDLIKNSK